MFVKELSKEKASLYQADENLVNQRSVKTGCLEGNVLETEHWYCWSKSLWIFCFCTKLPIWMYKSVLSTQTRNENVIFLTIPQSIQEEYCWYQKGLSKIMQIYELMVGFCMLRLLYLASTKCRPKRKRQISPKCAFGFSWIFKKINQSLLTNAANILTQTYVKKVYILYTKEEMQCVRLRSSMNTLTKSNGDWFSHLPF